MRVRYTAAASRELQQIVTYIADRNPSAAARMVARIEELVSLLANFPRVGRPRARSGVRMLPFPSTLTSFSTAYAWTRC